MSEERHKSLGFQESGVTLDAVKASGAAVPENLDAYLNAAREIVMGGMEASRTPLSHALEFRLSRIVAKHMREPVGCDMIVTRITRESERNARPERVAEIGDDCLITCGMFPERIRRRGGSVRFYSDVGRAAYDYAGLTEAAYGFSHMLTVLSAVAPTPAAAMLDLAAAGDAGALAALGNVVPFRKSFGAGVRN